MVEDPTKSTAMTNIQESPVQAFKDRDGVWFCLVETDIDWINEEHIDEIEFMFEKLDREERVVDTLVKEPEREEPAPVIGHAKHKGRNLLGISFDLSEWYLG